MTKYCIASPHKNELWYDHRLYVNLIEALKTLGHQHEAGAVNRIYFLGGPQRQFYPKVGTFDTNANNIALIYCHMESLQRLDLFDKVFVPSQFVKDYFEHKALELTSGSNYLFKTKNNIDIIRPFSSLKPVSEHRPKYNCDVMFMGTPRVRPIVEAILNIVEKHQLKMHIIGPNWAEYSGNPAAKRYVTERSVRYYQIPQVVRGAKICLHDHHDSMNQFQTCSHKYIDMVSAGGFVISDKNEDVRNVYKGIVFEDEQQLESMVLRYLSEDVERQAIVEKQRSIMSEQTTLMAAKQLAAQFIS